MIIIIRMMMVMVVMTLAMTVVVIMMMIGVFLQLAEFVQSQYYNVWKYKTLIDLPTGHLNIVL